MMKYLLILSLVFELYAYIPIPSVTKQILVVSSREFNDTQASLQAYERSEDGWIKVLEPITVNLGRNGLAWGEGIIEFKHKPNEPLKREGDGRAPAGLFSLDLFFGYSDNKFDFPYLKVDQNTLCIDDSESSHYNKIIQERDHTQFKSFEFMKREDTLYRLGIVVRHNAKNLKKHGSCIFIHIQKYEKSPTAGCTSLQEEQLLKIMNWLNKESSPLLLQLPDSYLQKGFR